MNMYNDEEREEYILPLGREGDSQAGRFPQRQEYGR
jgi:hypothetical protein